MNEEIARHLREEGYAVVPSVLSEEAQLRAVDGLWRYLEALGTGVDRCDPKTWTSRTLPLNTHGIDLLAEVAHRRFVWDVRRDPAVIGVFADLWGTDRLWSSFDRVCFVPAPELRGRAPVSTSWFHVDQSSRKPDFLCVQGLVTLGHTVDPKTGAIRMRPTTERDGTLRVLAGSHRAHPISYKGPDVPAAEKEWARDWHKFDVRESAKLLEDYESVRVEAPPGSMILWDSRAAHYGAPPQAGARRRA